LLAPLDPSSTGARDCLAASPFSKEEDDAAVLSCLEDEAARRSYGVAMFERSDSVPLLSGIPQGVEQFRDCIGAALSSQLVYDRLVEIATTARYWGADHRGDQVAADVINRQFSSCSQTLALG
jgi:hypothetical protein